jgi:hypothetical protein
LSVDGFMESSAGRLVVKNANRFGRRLAGANAGRKLAVGDAASSYVRSARSDSARNAVVLPRVGPR